VPGDRVGDHFVVRQRLGGGGMGDVYLAQHTSIPDLRCAIKVLQPHLSGNTTFVELLHAEARRQSRLEHDNVVQIRDFFAWQGRYCLVQQYVSGKTLSTLIAESPKGLPLDVALRLICEVLSGLHYAHSKAVLHCDVKPDNIIVDERGRARITDFGISQDMGAAGKRQGCIGTPPYMSPEQLQPSLEPDHRTDVFSSGVMLFEMLSGQLPFEGALPDGRLAQTVLDPPDVRRHRPEIPEILARIIATAMQRERNQRFSSCAEFRDAILTYQRRVRWRRTWLPAIAITAVVATVGLLALWRWSIHLHEQAVPPARELMVDAAKALNELCRSVHERDIRRPGLEIAKQMHDEKLVREFTRRAAETQANIEDAAHRYVSDLGKLRAIAADVTDEGQKLALAAAEDADIHWASERVANDLAAARTGGGPADTVTVISRCRPIHAR
jgi:hypothetical protein